MLFQSVQYHYQYTKLYCNWLDWLSLWRSKLCKKYFWIRMITVLESHPSSHHSPSPLPLTSHHSYSLLLTPFPITISHHSPQLTPLGLFTPLPPHPTTHHYSPSLHPLITPLTTGPLTTPSHLPSLPHVTSSPPSSPLPSLPTFLTTPPHHPLHHSYPHHSFTTLSPPPHPHPLGPSPLTPPPGPRPHHSLKGHNYTKELVKSHLSMSLQDLPIT